MLWLPGKRRAEGLKDMGGDQAQEVHGQVGMEGLFQLWQLPQLHRLLTVQLAFRSSQLNTAGPLFGTKSLLFWNVLYFIKYLKSTKGRQKKIPHSNIYILRAWSPGSGLNDGAREWKRQRGNIRITLWDRRVINRKTPHVLFAWLKNFLWATFFSHAMYLLITALFPTTATLVAPVITTNSAPTNIRCTLAAARGFSSHCHWNAVWDMPERTHE